MEAMSHVILLAVVVTVAKAASSSCDLTCNTNEIEPVCDLSTGLTYDNRCLYEQAQCLIGLSAEQIQSNFVMGECEEVTVADSDTSETYTTNDYLTSDPIGITTNTEATGTESETAFTTETEELTTRSDIAAGITINNGLATSSAGITINNGLATSSDDFNTESTVNTELTTATSDYNTELTEDVETNDMNTASTDISTKTTTTTTTSNKVDASSTATTNSDTATTVGVNTEKEAATTGDEETTTTSFSSSSSSSVKSTSFYVTTFSTTGVRTSYGTRRPDTGCRNYWREALIGRSIGGIRVYAFNLADCKKECEIVSSCAGFDLDASYSCWLHLNRTDMLRSYQQDRTMRQYRLDRCSQPEDECRDEWYQVLSGHSLRGMLSYKSSTVSDCRQECEAMKTCDGIDFDLKHSRCFLHLNKATMEGLYSQVFSVLQYRRRRCLDCVNIWDGVKDSYLDGGYLVSNVTTRDECMNRCILSMSANTCHSVDFSYETSQCYVHYDRQRSLSLTGKRITHYVLRQRCIAEDQTLRHRIAI